MQSIHPDLEKMFTYDIYLAKRKRKIFIIATILIALSMLLASFMIFDLWHIAIFGFSFLMIKYNQAKQKDILFKIIGQLEKLKQEVSVLENALIDRAIDKCILKMKFNEINKAKEYLFLLNEYLILAEFRPKISIQRIEKQIDQLIKN